MISLLRGTIAQKSASSLTLDVGGVGYHVITPLTTLASLPPEGSNISIHIHTHVREDQITLYGFETTDQKDLFLLVMKVQGIGPRIALTILSTLSPDRIESAINSNDAATLSSVPGIGKKTAERMIIELKGKIKTDTATYGQNTAAHSLRDDLSSALINLGYQRRDVDVILNKIDISTGDNLEDALKAALKELTR